MLNSSDICTGLAKLSPQCHRKEQPCLCVQAAYEKICDSSQTLLDVLKRESNLMTKRHHHYNQEALLPISTFARDPIRSP